MNIMIGQSPLNEERQEALNVQVTFNQIRNSVGILTEIFEETYGKEGATEKDIIERLRNMGRNIARTYARYWTPEPRGLEIMLLDVYKMILGSNVSVEEPADRKTVRKDYVGKKVFDVINPKCPLCKGKRATNIGGCELVLGLVEGMFETLRQMKPGMDVPQLMADECMETRTRGDERCRHRFVLDRGV